MAERYDAGIVTAYGAAVRGGYTGTYDEFCAQQAGYAQNAAAVEQAKSDAQTAAQAAQDVADSIPADYSQMSADVTQLQADTNTLKEDISSLSDLYKKTECKNIFDKDALISGYYYTQAGQGGGGSAAYSVLPALKLEAGIPYSSSGTAMREAFTYYATSEDGARSMLSSISDAGIEIVTGNYIKLSNFIPSSDIYLFITVGNSDNISSFMIVNDSSLPETYSAFNVVYKTVIYGAINNYLQKDQGAENVGKILSVDSDGNVVPVINSTDAIYFRHYSNQFLNHDNLDRLIQLLSS